MGRVLIPCFSNELVPYTWAWKERLSWNLE